MPLEQLNANPARAAAYNGGPDASIMREKNQSGQSIRVKCRHVAIEACANPCQTKVFYFSFQVMKPADKVGNQMYALPLIIGCPGVITLAHSV